MDDKVNLDQIKSTFSNLLIESYHFQAIGIGEVDHMVMKNIIIRGSEVARRIATTVFSKPLSEFQISVSDTNSALYQCFVEHNFYVTRNLSDLVLDPAAQSIAKKLDLLRRVYNITEIAIFPLFNKQELTGFLFAGSSSGFKFKDLLLLQQTTTALQEYFKPFPKNSPLSAVDPSSYPYTLPSYRA